MKSRKGVFMRTRRAAHISEEIAELQRRLMYNVSMQFMTTDPGKLAELSREARGLRNRIQALRAERG